MTSPLLRLALPDRGLVCISGSDRRAFLQGLITNDITLLDTQPCLYACLLTPNGKFLHDFFITEQNDTVFLDCEGGTRAEDLAARLAPYKLRADIRITVHPVHCVHVLWHEDGTSRNAENLQPEGCAPDPRHPAMGWRTLAGSAPDSWPPALQTGTFTRWDSHRIRLGIPEGSRDMIPEQATLAESQIFHLNGISFSKGCYMGQELTARMHYRNLGKKRLRPVAVAEEDQSLPPWGAPILINGTEIGHMRSACGHMGLALLRDSQAALLPKKPSPRTIGEGFIFFLPSVLTKESNPESKHPDPLAMHGQEL